MPTVLAPDTVLDLEGEGGRWFEAIDDGRGLKITAGYVSRRGGIVRRATRAEWRIRHVGGDVELLGLWPVREVLTDVAGEIESDLIDELAQAGGGADHLALLLAGAATAIGAEPRPTLAGLVWGAAYPLLRPAVDAGVPLRAVPLPIERLLRSPNPRVGVQRLLRHRTRPLIRTTAARLLPDDDGTLTLDPLVVASMGAGLLGPEQLTTIIGTDPVEPGTVAFSLTDIERARLFLTTLDRGRAATLLQRALAEHDGLRALADRITAWNPPPPPAPTAPAQRRRPARTVAPDAAACPIGYPTGWREAVGKEVVGHTIVLPDTGNDLIRWGRTLSNCLGSYRYAAASGRSRIIGLERKGVLQYAVEVTPGGAVRQIEGPNNRQPRGPFGRQVVLELRQLGLVEVDGRTGASLLPP